VVVYLLFTVYIVSVFLACFYNGCACDRFSAWSCSLKRAVYSTPDSQCLECYIIPFIHSRNNAKDRSLGVGRDIRCRVGLNKTNACSEHHIVIICHSCSCDDVLRCVDVRCISLLQRTALYCLISVSLM